MIRCTFLEFHWLWGGFSEFRVVHGNCGQNAQNLHDSLIFCVEFSAYGQRSESIES